MISTMMAPPRVLGLLVGNVKNPTSDARVKYGQLFTELGKQAHLVDVHDVELRGLDRYQNALRTIRWPRQRWREAFYKNPWAFQRRTQRIQALVKAHAQRADVILQHGTIFSAAGAGLPVIVYTDFTYRLAQREDPWRDPFTDPVESELWNQLEGDVARAAAFVLTRSEYARQSLINDYGIAPERVAVVGGGVNFESLPASAPQSSARRILFIGRGFERKGGPQLLAAFRKLREALPDAELWLVTDRTGLEGPGIRCITSAQDRAAIGALYRDASVFALPSRCETWGDVFLEAMAYGLPCIGTTNDAMPEIILHGQTGYVVEPDDVPALTRYLELLLSDSERRRQMGAEGRERVLRHFTWEHVARRMLPYIEQAKEEYVHLPEEPQMRSTR